MKFTTKKWIFSVLIALVSTVLMSQDMAIKINCVDQPELEIKTLIGDLPEAIDSSLAVALGDTLELRLQELGYLTASMDSLKLIDSSFHYHFYLGRTFVLKDLIIDRDDEAILQGSGFHPGYMADKILTQANLDFTKNKVLTHLADRGYPFATIGVDSIIIDDRHISSKLDIERNELITYDTILITGDARVNKSFLHKYLNIRKGDPYRQSDILALRDRINNLPFVQFKADPRISFVNSKASFDFPLVNRNASRFDFIIGVLPRVENGVRQWTITGDFTGEFVNKLGNGESFSIRYQRLRPETQELVLDVDYPFVFNLPFGIDGHFELFRNTTDFLDVKAGLGITYNISRKDFLEAGWSFTSSRLIEIDTSTIIATQKLPQQLDVDVTSGRVAITLDRRNRFLNPTSGNRMRLNLQAGQKKIIPNVSISSIKNDQVDFSNAYDSLQLRTLQLQVDLEVDFFINVRNWSTVYLANRSAYKYNQRRLFKNEFFRIGGNKLLRGFNEQSIFTPFYSIFTSEFRIILDELSYISMPFIDYGFFRMDDGTQQTIERVIGVGIGLNFATKAGIFNIAFAAGNEDRNGINFGNTKIHFGYVNLF